MALSTDPEPPPKASDLDGWRLAIAEKRYLNFRLEDIVAAIQDLGPHCDKEVLNPLAKHLSDALLRILRKYVSRSYPNEGLNIIERTHGMIVDAVLRPTSRDGKALREAFGPRVKFRLKDALIAEDRAARTGCAEIGETSGSKVGSDTTPDVPDEWPISPHHNPARTTDEHIDVERILEQIPHDKKRLAFRLHMDGIPCRSSKSDSIAKALGISEKTARLWVKEAQQLLSLRPEVQEILKSKSMRGMP